MVFARVPASTANLGPGFDTLAVALELYVEVSLELADTFSLTSGGEGAGQFDDEHHLAVVVASRVLGHRNFAMHVHSQIPVSRGLGSSAALAVAAGAAAGAASALELAVEVDGHAENAAASVLGGLVTAARGAEGVIVRSLALDGDWRFVVVVPDQALATEDARKVLPAQVPFADAVRNLNAMGLLLAGLADHRAFVPSAMDDALHQPYRSSLLPFAGPLLARLRESGAAGSCWSGAGSAMLGLATLEVSAQVASAAREFLRESGVAGTVYVLDADRVGLTTS